MGAVIEEMTNILENFGVDLQINQLEIAFAQPFKNLSNIYIRKFQNTSAKKIILKLNCKTKSTDEKQKMTNWKKKVMRKITL